MIGAGGADKGTATGITGVAGLGGPALGGRVAAASGIGF